MLNSIYYMFIFKFYLVYLVKMISLLLIYRCYSKVNFENLEVKLFLKLICKVLG